MIPRQPNGQFVKGFHYSPSTEFKKGINYNKTYDIKHPSGKEARAWKGGMVTLICEVCKTPFQRDQSKSKRKFCSQKCYGKYRIGRFPSWSKGMLLVSERTDNRGVPPNYRKLILERDNCVCQICKKSFPKEKLEIDHIIPFKIVKKHSVENLRTLCKKCHRNTPTYGKSKYRGVF